MQARSFNNDGEIVAPSSFEEYFVWSRHNNDNSTMYIKINKSLFDDDSQLINVLPANWKESMAIFEHLVPPQFMNDNDLPF